MTHTSLTVQKNGSKMPAQLKNANFGVPKISPKIPPKIVGKNKDQKIAFFENSRFKIL